MVRKHCLQVVVMCVSHVTANFSCTPHSQRVQQITVSHIFREHACILLVRWVMGEARCSEFIVSCEAASTQQASWGDARLLADA